jgi:putative aldouronate transport system permease protein
MAEIDKINCQDASKTILKKSIDKIAISMDDSESTQKLEEKVNIAVLDELEKHYWKNIGKKIIKDWRLYLMVLPMVLVFFLWRYMPLYGLIGAFKVNDTTVQIFDREFVGINYFYKLIFGEDSAGFWQAFRNTFMISFYGLLFGFPVPIILALFFNEVKSNILRSSIQICTYLPRFVSTVVITTLITMLLKGGSIFAEPGILAQFFDKIGLVSSEDAYRGMLRVPKYFRAIYQISGIWETAGYNSIVFFAAIIGISPTSYEAAKIDGASKLAQLRYVVLPGMASTITIMLILNLGGLLSIGYEKVLLLYDKEIYSTADIVSTYVFRMAGMDGGQENTNQALASAADLMAAVLSMLLVIGSNMVSRKVSETSLY